MGTTISIKAYFPFYVSHRKVLKEVKNRLNDLNHSMSTYVNTSEISYFNKKLKENASLKVSKDFYHVLIESKKLYKLSKGAFDPSIYPLVEVWQFYNRTSPDWKVPTDDVLTSVKAYVNFDGLELLDNQFIRKRFVEMKIDLSSIAKGYAVDKVSECLEKLGSNAYMVEIGGEVFARGYKPNGNAWKIGIRDSLDTKKVVMVLSLDGQGLATSGNYMNFFEIDGRRYTHVIDPRTGYPVMNGVASVSVRAPTTMQADALATALMVLGLSGFSMIEKLKDTEACIFMQDKGGKLTRHITKGFF